MKIFKITASKTSIHHLLVLTMAAAILLIFQCRAYAQTESDEVSVMYVTDAFYDVSSFSADCHRKRGTDGCYIVVLDVTSGYGAAYSDDFLSQLRFRDDGLLLTSNQDTYYIFTIPSEGASVQFINEETGNIVGSAHRFPANNPGEYLFFRVEIREARQGIELPGNLVSNQNRRPRQMLGRQTRDSRETTISRPVEEVRAVRIENTEEEAAKDNDTFDGRVEEMMPDGDVTIDLFDVVDSEPKLIGGTEWVLEKKRMNNYDTEDYAGEVMLRFEVSKTGAAENIVVASGENSQVDLAAIDIISSAQFEPAKFNGNPIRVLYSMLLRFE